MFFRSLPLGSSTAQLDSYSPLHCLRVPCPHLGHNLHPLPTKQRNRIKLAITQSARLQRPIKQPIRLFGPGAPLVGGGRPGEMTSNLSSRRMGAREVCSMWTTLAKYFLGLDLVIVALSNHWILLKYSYMFQTGPQLFQLRSMPLIGIRTMHFASKAGRIKHPPLCLPKIQKRRVGVREAMVWAQLSPQ